jgi:hypothetical protein
MAEHLAPPAASSNPSTPVDVLKDVQQAAHPRRGDRQRATARSPPRGLGALQAQVKLTRAADPFY